MKRLIVNADDFGLTEKVNEAILHGHRQGIITSASLLANGEAFESAVALARGAPRLGVGVHLNLTEGRAVSPPGSIPSLGNAQEVLAKSLASLWRGMILKRVSAAEIERELRAQIEKVLRAGVAVTHLDSHKHVHALPRLAKIVIALAREYRIPAIRCVVERRPALGVLLRRYPSGAAVILKQFALSSAAASVSARWRRLLGEAGLVSASHFLGVTATGFLDEDVLREILSRLPQGTSELMCHPGWVDEALKQTPTRLLVERETEVHALTQPATKQLIRELGIQLISYRDLAYDRETERDENSSMRRPPSSADGEGRSGENLRRSHAGSRVFS